ncbi:MAG: hypothetical protein ABIJ41_03285 [Candidatus Omnitrophota bacterium]
MKRYIFLFMFTLISVGLFNRAAYAGTATATLILPIEAAKFHGMTNLPNLDAQNGAWRLLFDGTSLGEIVEFIFALPQDYSSAPVIKLLYTMVSATSGKVDMEVYVHALSDDESDPDSAVQFDSLNEVLGGTTVPGTAGILDEISISLANDDSMAANDWVRLRIKRDPSDSDDTATTDLELRAVTLEYTSNR